MAAAAETGRSVPQPGLRERAKRQRRQRIVDAALDLLREDPSQNPTVERISERAEVAPMTIYNLVGGRNQMWAAMIDRALDGLDVSQVSAADPQDRARQIVDAVVNALRGDAIVFGALLRMWSDSALVLARDPDPTAALEACLQEVLGSSGVQAQLSAARYAEVITAGLLGAMQQWTAGVLSDRAFRLRARTIVDVVFAAAGSNRQTS